MNTDLQIVIRRRAAVHRALGDETRLAIIDTLWSQDCTPAQLRQRMGLRSNLLAFHLDVLEEAGLVSRHASQGDGRRRYVTLEPEAVMFAAPQDVQVVGRVLFVCTANSARSQLATALWRRYSPIPASSAGLRPADRVHRAAVTVARRHGLQLEDRPRGYADVTQPPDLVISVCDRAGEAALPFSVPSLHWSVADPVTDQRPGAFESAYEQLDARIVRFTAQVVAA